jgi:hypothetical protein
MLSLVPLDRYEFSKPFLLYQFLKIPSLLCRILDYKMFSGGFLVSHNSVNELCYIAQFVNSIVT